MSNKPACLRASKARPGRLNFEVVECRDLRLSIERDGLPNCLLDALAALKHGEVRNANAILDEKAIEQVSSIQPEELFLDAAFVLATILSRVGRYSQAEEWFLRFLEKRPEPVAYVMLAEMVVSQGRLWDGVKYVKKALEIAPENLRLQAILAGYLIKAGSCEDGVAILQWVSDSIKDRIVHSKLLWHLHQLQNLDPQYVYDQHRLWASRYAPTSVARTDHDNDPDPDRRLRIGYISPDFYGHSVAYFFESLLDGHDRAQVELIGYGNVARQDDVTERFKAKFDVYRNIRPLSDQDVFRLISEDKIDILVDLAGHTTDNRLFVLSRRPAPIQVSFLGYPDTTGLEQVDYRFTDQWADLPDAQRFYTERLIRLPSGFICYRPPEFAPPVRQLPALTNGFVTFCSFNNNQKINPTVMDIWAAILRSVPDSRLLLKFPCGDDPVVARFYIKGLASRGVDPSRVTVLGRLPVIQHLDLYNQADIGLDTFPYHGTTTTCEALWMGVPVISLIGSHHVSRVGLSILSRVGLEAFASTSVKEYIAKAVALAKQTTQLAAIRQGLRKAMARSRLCDYKAYSRDVEAAYRQMWQDWCKARTGTKAMQEVPV